MPLVLRKKVCIIHPVTSKQLIKKLIEEGWILKSTKGSHHHFVHPTKNGKVTIPHPKKEIPLGTLKNIFKQAGLE